MLGKNKISKYAWLDYTFAKPFAKWKFCREIEIILRVQEEVTCSKRRKFKGNLKLASDVVCLIEEHHWTIVMVWYINRSLSEFILSAKK